MVELALPKNSKITGGNVWPKPAGATNLREFGIYRWSPDDDLNPRVDTYYVDLDDCGRWCSTHCCGSRTRSIRR